MLNNYLTNTTIAFRPHAVSWVESRMNLYEDKMIFYVIIKASEKKNSFAVTNGRETYEKCDGMILRKVWKSLSGYSNNCELKDCDIRCDEFHGVVLIDKTANVERILTKVISEFKSRSTTLINNYRGTFGKPIWENVFRLDSIRNYTDLFNIITQTWA
jgi:hypothetical protein